MVKNLKIIILRILLWGEENELLFSSVCPPTWKMTQVHDAFALEQLDTFRFCSQTLSGDLLYAWSKNPV